MKALVTAFVLMGGCLLRGQDYVVVPKLSRGSYSLNAATTTPGCLDLQWGVAHMVGREQDTATTVPAQLYLGVCSSLDLRLFWTGPTCLRSEEGEVHSGLGDPCAGIPVAGRDPGEGWGRRGRELPGEDPLG
jgi:hypothetical protein